MSAPNPDTFTVTDEGDLRTYRTEIPNIVFDLGLSPHALALYCHYKRTCGAAGGTCRQNTKTLAERLSMSVGKVVDARRELEQHFEALGELPLIRIDEQPGRGRYHVRIVNIWGANFLNFAPQQEADSEQAGAEQADPEQGAAEEAEASAADEAALDAGEQAGLVDYITPDTPDDPEAAARGEALIREERVRLGLVEALRREGMTGVVAERLVDRYPPERIQRQLDSLDAERAAGESIHNPGGRLRKMIEEDWPAVKAAEPRVASDRPGPAKEARAPSRPRPVPPAYAPPPPAPHGAAASPQEIRKLLEKAGF